MNNLSPIPIYVPLVFMATTFLTAYLFYKVSRWFKVLLLAIVGMLTLTAIVGLSGFFADTRGLPPRFALMIGPTTLFIIWLFISKPGKRFLNRLNQADMTLLHIVRVPVEIVLYWLFLSGNVPELMTFAGRNFDILAGISAPIIYYLGYKQKVLSKPILIAWNVICLGLVLFVLINGILSSPFELQQFGFDQPNKAVLHFPYIWLPGFIVPIVVLCHINTIRQLVRD